MFKIISSVFGLVIGGWLMSVNAQAATEQATPRFQQAVSGKWIDRQLPSVEHPGQFMVVASHNGHAVGQRGKWLLNGVQVSATAWLNQQQNRHSQAHRTAAKRQVAVMRPVASSTSNPAAAVQLAAQKSKNKSATTVDSNGPATGEEATTPATNSQTPITDDSLRSSSVSPEKEPQTAKAPSGSNSNEPEPSYDAANAATEPTKPAKLPQTSEYRGLLRVSGIISLTLTVSWWFISKKSFRTH